MSASDELLERAAAYAGRFGDAEASTRPATGTVIVTCMDARLDPGRIFGLEPGDAHVLRNAGGVVTDDVVRSLAISQRLLGTSEILLVHHADCGMRTFGDDDFRRAVFEETGIRPPWAAEAFADAAEDVRQSIARIAASPFVPRKDAVRGFVYDEKTGSLAEVG